MKKNILTVAVFFFALTAYPQNSGEAKAILDRAFAAFEASAGIKLSFKSATVDKDGTEYETQSGEAIIKGNRFKIQTDAADIWFDGETQWILIKEVNEVNIINPTGQELASISPLALLGMYRNGYKLKAPVSKTVNGKKVNQIDMVPVTGNNDFKAVSVAVDMASNNIVQIILTMGNGMKNRIEISDCNSNYKFIDSEFRFDKNKHPGVEIVDLR